MIRNYSYGMKICFYNFIYYFLAHNIEINLPHLTLGHNYLSYQDLRVFIQSCRKPGVHLYYFIYIEVSLGTRLPHINFNT